jgi:hypothetical protein
VKVILHLYWRLAADTWYRAGGVISRGIVYSFPEDGNLGGKNLFIFVTDVPFSPLFAIGSGINYAKTAC